ncbi:MAG: hypothetical protein AAFV53_01975 [Myxococcota bacterium]
MATQLLAMALATSDIALAMAVFVLMARPERAMGWLCRLNGMRELWLSGRLTEQDESRLLALAHRLRWPMLWLLFGWSFVCGAILTWAQLAR